MFIKKVDETYNLNKNFNFFLKFGVFAIFVFYLYYLYCLYFTGGAAGGIFKVLLNRYLDHYFFVYCESTGKVNLSGLVEKSVISNNTNSNIVTASSNTNVVTSNQNYLNDSSGEPSRGRTKEPSRRENTDNSVIRERSNTVTRKEVIKDTISNTDSNYYLINLPIKKINSIPTLKLANDILKIPSDYLYN